MRQVKNPHLELSMDDDESSIRDFVPVFQRIDQVVPDVEHRRNAHLITCVRLVLLEMSVASQFVGEVSEGDTGTGITTPRGTHRICEVLGQ